MARASAPTSTRSWCRPCTPATSSSPTTSGPTRSPASRGPSRPPGPHSGTCHPIARTSIPSSSASRSSRPSFAPLAVAAPRRSGRSSASAWRTSALTNAATIFGTAGTRPPHGHEKRFSAAIPAATWAPRSPTGAFLPWRIFNRMRLGDYADGAWMFIATCDTCGRQARVDPAEVADPSTHPSPHARGRTRDPPALSGLPPQHRADRPRRPPAHAAVCRRDDLTRRRGTPPAGTTRARLAGLIGRDAREVAVDRIDQGRRVVGQRVRDDRPRSVDARRECTGASRSGWSSRAGQSTAPGSGMRRIWTPRVKRKLAGSCYFGDELAFVAYRLTFVGASTGRGSAQRSAKSGRDLDACGAVRHVVIEQPPDRWERQHGVQTAVVSSAPPRSAHGSGPRWRMRAGMPIVVAACSGQPQTRRVPAPV